MKYLANIFLVVILTLSLSGCGCDKGDYLGPTERFLRTVLNGWDMWDTEMVATYQQPMPQRPQGIISTDGHQGFSEGQAAYQRLSPKQQQQASRLAYRRFCYHCHGPNGDARIIVGESFGVRLPDLRLPKSQQLTDEQMFRQVYYGSKNMVPLQETLTPLQTVAAIKYVRTLAGAPSVPFFEPKSVNPIR